LVSVLFSWKEKYQKFKAIAEGIVIIFLASARKVQCGTYIKEEESF
jgi:hypothetical protein